MMKKLNIFNTHSPVFGFRWIIIAFLAAMGTMAWLDLSGTVMFSGSQSQWVGKGPGYHK